MATTDQTTTDTLPEAADQDRLFAARIAAALAGDAQALDALLRAIEPRVYRLAIRMCGNFADAEDATQEILIKVTTSLARFEGRSRFTTWVYRIAANHLHDVVSRPNAAAARNFDDIAARLDAGLAATAGVDMEAMVDRAGDPRLALEAREIGLRCTQGMLLCLDADHRIALLLTEVFGLDTATAAEVLDIAPAALRQRCSRAQRRMTEFLQGRCGLLDPAAACRCARQALAKRGIGEAVPIEFATRAGATDNDVRAARDELSLLQRYAAHLRAAPDWQAPEALHQRVHAVLRATPLVASRQ